MISVEEARMRLLQLASPLEAEKLSLSECPGRYLAQNLIALRTQPSADLSAMDGYALRYADLGSAMKVVGESAAGKPFQGQLSSGEAVRIFTGAILPPGADCVMVQEEAERAQDRLILRGDGPAGKGSHIRRAGIDFMQGDILLAKGAYLNAGAVALAAMGGYGCVYVGKRPTVAIIGAGDELVPPGHNAGPAQIPSSNNVMLNALLKTVPANVQDHGIAADTLDSLAIKLAECGQADIIVTSGGASVGDYDLVQKALINAGAHIDFWQVALRPGKPLMAGTLGNALVIGLPGNPTSAFVTAFLFLLPLVRHLTGSIAPWPSPMQSVTKQAISAGGPRTEYLRAIADHQGISAINKQDSGLTSTLANANALLIRDIGAPAVSPGEPVTFYPI
jgi:molybdopterin molybdotransferase